MKPDRIINVDDAREAARRALPRSIFDYVDGGAEYEVTLRRNREAFSDIAFMPRAATNVSQPDLRTEICGLPMSMPIMLAPCGQVRLAHPDGDVAAGRAAKAAGTASVLSAASGHTLEEVARHSSGFFQLYTYGGRAGTESLIERAREAGYHGLIVTVDTPITGNRERDRRNGYVKGIKPNLANAIRFGPGLATRPLWLMRFLRGGLKFELANVVDERNKACSAGEMADLVKKSPPTWDDIKWIRRFGPDRPLIVKGLLSADDARRALDCGADGVVVSNRGGRQLDGAPATVEALPAVVDAVGDRIPVLMDGGIRRGTDVARAIALGATAVLVGRPYIYGLAMGGQAGVAHVLDILRTELERTMIQLGCPSIRELDRSYLLRQGARPGDSSQPKPEPPAAGMVRAGVAR